MDIPATIDETKSVRLNLDVVGSCETLTQSAIFDSGFNGDIVMPIDVAVRVGLESGGMTTIELADGYTQDFPIFLCTVVIGGIEQKASVIVMGTGILLGMGLMDPFKICLQPSTSEVVIQPTSSYSNFVGMMNRIVESSS